MSRLYWHGQHHTSEILGSEHAYMGSLVTDLAAPVVSDRYPANGVHRFTRIVPTPGKYGWVPTSDEMVRLYLFSDHPIHFDGEDHDTFGALLNTLIATEAPILCLIARLRGTCELHAWVAEEDREWLAGLIDGGRANNILRAGAGWEKVIEHLRNGDGGPVVTSYSVCDEFPSMSACDWMDPAWPAAMVATKTYDYNVLTDLQKQAVSARQDEWYDLDRDERWRLAFEGLQRKPYLQITPENLTRQGFYDGKSLWDAVASPEWRGETKAGEDQ